MATKYVNRNSIPVTHGEKETIYGKSKTVPNQSYTIKELISLNKKGISPNVLKEALYEMDSFGEELNPLRQPNFDLSDIDGIQQTVKAYQTKQENLVKKQKLKQKEDERIAIIEQWKTENNYIDPEPKS